MSLLLHLIQLQGSGTDFPLEIYGVVICLDSGTCTHHVSRSLLHKSLTLPTRQDLPSEAANSSDQTVLEKRSTTFKAPKRLDLSQHCTMSPILQVWAFVPFLLALSNAAAAPKPAALEVRDGCVEGYYCGSAEGQSSIVSLYNLLREFFLIIVLTSGILQLSCSDPTGLAIEICEPKGHCALTNGAIECVCPGYSSCLAALLAGIN